MPTEKLHSPPGDEPLNYGPACLSQHLVVLNLVTFAPADLPLQCVLVEPPADVDQQGRRAGVDGTAEDHVAHAGGHVDPEPQDHTDQQTFSDGQRGSVKNAKYIIIIIARIPDSFNQTNQ